ncbi:hypothetical protein [Polaribacter septentrionalilitoris]|uniref:hypothetical protein n=1 Tax=Polaribacter septentrionalilitoris TaxID=2494657 RepID=UPI001359D33A|nr:hypothetical protein [Polaribacter septentrionalilitoris]
MKKILLLFTVSLFILSCGKEESKKKEVQTIKKDTIVQPEKVIVEEVEPQQFFTVQIAALRQRNDKLEKLENIQVFLEDGYIKYRLGDIPTYEEAHKYRDSIIHKYPGAFVQAIKGTIAISIRDALQQ